MRQLVPELLDLLPADDPAAIRSRHDLARINWIMRQPVIMARALATCPPPKILADLGSGDGRFLLAVAKRMARRWPGVTALICDRQDILSDRTRLAFARLGWRCEVRRGDIFETLPAADIVTANLFLHHFDDAALKRLLAVVASKTRAFIACEPRRNAFAVLGARMVWALGANRVTRHDALASVRAGFTGHELSSLWPQGGWRLNEHASFPFSHVFTAHAP
jgi:O-methyltransferase domain